MTVTGFLYADFKIYVVAAYQNFTQKTQFLGSTQLQPQ
jgi:hypothetical protein